MNQADLERLAAAVRSVTERYHGFGYFPSACVRVFDAEKCLVSVCVGDASENDLFDVASLTKLATSTQVLLLADAGRLSLEDRIADFFPEIREDAFLSERLRGVTLLSLLTHTSGIADWYPFYEKKGEPFFSVLSWALKNTPPVSGVVYSDLNFMLLGKLLERVHEMGLSECLQRHLVQPLGLGRMLYRPQALEGERIIPSDYGNPIEMEMCRERGISFDGFRPLGVPVTGTVNDGNCHYYFDDVAGHAGIFATTQAYMRLCQFYLNTDRPLLQSAVRQQPGSPGRGLGFQTTAMYPGGCGHTGFTGTAVWFSRERRIGAVSFTNRLFFPNGNPEPTNDFRRALHETVYALTTP